MRMFFIVGAVALALAGCQSAEQSYYDAKSTCSSAGLKAGTARYNKCVDAAYNTNRRNAQQSSNAAAVGIAAAAVGGAVIGSTTSRRSYRYYPRHRYYRRGYYY